MIARDAEATEFAQLARLWHDGWLDAHERILPADLARQRTLESFEQRLRSSAARLRVAGPVGCPAGLCITRDDEINQLFVAALARGLGVASTLLADGESKIRSDGHRRGWLSCAIGNLRAARFYEKHGWTLAREAVIQLSTLGGVFPLKVWRYEKGLWP